MIKQLKVKNDYFAVPFFFIQLLGFFWPAYIFLGLHLIWNFKIKPVLEEKTFYIISILYIILKLSQGVNVKFLIFLKTFFGVYFFIIYFRYFNKAKLEKILIPLMTITIWGEFVFKFFSSSAELKKHFWEMATPRPAGFGENVTITAGVTLVFIFYYFEKISINWKRLLIGNALICGSGLGFFGLGYFWIQKKWELVRKNKLKLLGAFILFLSTYLVFYLTMGSRIYSGNFLYKMSPYYFKILLDLKIKMFQLELKSFSSIKEILIGIKWSGEHFNGGDFGWMQVFSMSGMFGIIFNIYFLKVFTQNKKAFYFILFALFHYNLIWWPAGQIFLGYVLGSNLEEHKRKSLNLHQLP